MKIRTDYVTNSSSSSFIIGKKDDNNITIESVYQIIRKYYKEYLHQRDKIIKYITDNPKLGVIYKLSDDGTYYSFKYTKGKRYDSENIETDEEIEAKFGISTWEYFLPEYDWLECKTYKEYTKYWLKKISNADNYRIHAPFTIADFFEEKEINWLHYNHKSIHQVNSKSDTLNWYYNYIDEAFAKMESCAECEYISWCDREKCEQQKMFLKGKDIPEDKACLYLLGRVCIHSECGYIPDYVVEKLREISEYSCNHMG